MSPTTILKLSSLSAFHLKHIIHIKKSPFIAISFFLLIASGLLAEEMQLRFTQLSVSDGLSQNSVMAIARDKYGFMWFGTWEGLSRYDGYEFRVFRTVANDPGSITNNRINAVITDETGNLWVTTGDNRFIFRFNYEIEKFDRFSPEKVDTIIRNKLNYSITQRRSVTFNHYHWQISNKGLLQTNTITGKTIDYKPDVYSPMALRDEVVNVLFIDKNNMLWVGTQHGGVHVANLNARHFGFLQPGNQNLSGNIVRAINQDSAGNIWVGTDAKGVKVYSRKGGEMIQTRVYGSESLIDTNIRSIYTDSYGFVWIGTKGGLNRYDPATGHFRYYYALQQGSIGHPWVFFITEDSYGNLWLGTFAGLARYNRAKDQFVTYANASFLNSNSIRYILSDNNRDLWIATEGAGITRLIPDTTDGFYNNFTPVHYRYNENDVNSLINDLVLSLQQDELGFIWIGTNSGLCRLDPQTGEFKRFSVATGFPDDLIMGMIADKKGHVWISHKKGITRINIHTFDMRTFNTYDGLQGDEFSQNASFMNSKSGEMFFGGTRGVNYFFPDKIKPVTSQPKPVLTSLYILNQPVLPGVKINGRELLQQSLILTSGIELRNKDSFFSLSFSSLDFSNPQGSVYRYRLIGAHSEWIYTNATKRNATYSHLPAGSYRFELHAANSDGVWSVEPVTLLIKVLPPWWFSWWAKIFYMLLLAFVIWMVFHFLASRLKFRNQLALEQLKYEKNEELMNSKIQFFTGISHEFRTPLTLIIEPLDRLIEDEPDAKKRQYLYGLMSRNARQLLDLLNQLLDFRKLQTGKLNIHYISDNLITFVRNTAASFDHKARGKHIRFAVLSNHETLTVHFDPDKMRKILNNLLANAFRFTPDFGEIIVRIYLPELNQGFVCIEVEDNGPGVHEEHRDKIFDAFYQSNEAKQSEHGTGLGLALSKELVLMHGGEISVERGNAGGAKFTVSIPLIRDEVKLDIKEENDMQLSAVLIENTEGDNANAGKKPLLLVVDDHEDIRNYIVQLFKANFKVIVAADGLAGYQKACEFIPDIIISDVMMQGVDGNELCRRLKSDEQTRHIPVILLTSLNTDAGRIEGYQTGADAYIVKPFSKLVLESRVHNLLEQRKQWLLSYRKRNGDDAKGVPINITDDAFMAKATSIVAEHIAHADFESAKLAEMMKISRTQLYRRIRAITNRSVHDFIITIRMNKAREYLLSGNCSVSETAYKVGFTLPTNFTRTFTKYFGMSPSKYIEKYRK